MTEYDGLQNGTAALVESEMLQEDDRIEAAVRERELHKAHVDAERGVFITSRGGEIALSGQPISSLMLERITNSGKPKIPRKEVLILGKHKEMQANAHDPDYLALLAEWEGEQNINVMRYVFVIGAKGQPPQEFVDTQKQFFPDATNSELKYLYVCSLLPDEDIDVFTSAIIGKGLPTAEGIKQAENFTE